MKRTLALLLACALGFGLLAGCSGKSDPTYGPGDSSFTPPPLEYDGYSHVLYPVASSPKVEGALADFGLELLKQARAANAEKAMASEWDHVPFSTFISPLSVAMVLSMAANGADGETLTQFLEVLGGGADLEELRLGPASAGLPHAGRLDPVQHRQQPVERPQRRHYCGLYRHMPGRLRSPVVLGGPVRPPDRGRPERLGVGAHQQNDPGDHQRALR